METAAVDSSSSLRHYLHGATDFKGEDGFTNQDDDGIISLLKGVLEEVDVKGRKWFEGFVSRVDEGHFWQTWDHYKGKGASDMLEKLVEELRKGKCNGGEKGVDGGTLSKLEKFGIKIVNKIGVGVVEEEERPKK